MIRSRLKYTPASSLAIKTSTFSDGHDHAYFARWVAMMWANYIFKINDIDT